MNSSAHHRSDFSDVDEMDVRKKKRKRSVSRDLSSEMERSMGKQSVASNPSTKKPTTQKPLVQEPEKTLLKLPLGNTMGALSTMRSLSQPSPTKRPRTSKSKPRTANPSGSLIHVTGAASISDTASGVSQGVASHSSALQGFPLHSSAVARQVPLSSSASRGQTFISLTPKSSEAGARVTQTFITIPRGTSPTVISSSPGGGQTVQYIIKPQSQRHAPVSLGAVSATLNAQSSAVASSSQLPSRSVVSAPVRHTALSQSSSSSFTSVVGLKGTPITTLASSAQPGTIVKSNVKFTATSGCLNPGRPSFTRISGDVSQPSTINLLTKDGNTLVVSQPISSGPLKGSYKLVSGSSLSGATLQAVAGGTVSLTSQPQVVVGHPSAITTQSVVDKAGQSLKFTTPTGTAVSLPDSLAAVVGKLPNNSTIAQPVGGSTVVNRSQVASLSSQSTRTVPSQIVTAQKSLSISAAMTCSITTSTTTVTLSRGGISYVTKAVPRTSHPATDQPGSSHLGGKLVSTSKVSSLSAAKPLLSNVISVSEATSRASCPVLTTGSATLCTVKAGGTERQTGTQVLYPTAFTNLTESSPAAVRQTPELVLAAAKGATQPLPGAVPMQQSVSGEKSKAIEHSMVERHTQEVSNAADTAAAQPGTPSQWAVSIPAEDSTVDDSSFVRS